MGFFNVGPCSYNDSIAGYTREVVEAEEKRKKAISEMDFKIEQECKKNKQKHLEEHERRMNEDPEYKRQYEKMMAEEEQRKQEIIKKCREEEAKREEKLEKMIIQQRRRRRFDECVRVLADDYDKGLASGGIKEACFICEEYYLHGDSADVTKEDFEEAFRKVLAFAYQNCNDDTMAEEYYCDECCKGRDAYYYCKGALLLKSDESKKLCLYLDLVNNQIKQK